MRQTYHTPLSKAHDLTIKDELKLYFMGKEEEISISDVKGLRNRKGENWKNWQGYEYAQNILNDILK